jgi:hypothetical protein
MMNTVGGRLAVVLQGSKYRRADPKERVETLWICPVLCSQTCQLLSFLFHLNG